MYNIHIKYSMWNTDTFAKLWTKYTFMYQYVSHACEWINIHTLFHKNSPDCSSSLSDTVLLHDITYNHTRTKINGSQQELKKERTKGRSLLFTRVCFQLCFLEKLLVTRIENITHRILTLYDRFDRSCLPIDRLINCQTSCLRRGRYFHLSTT